MKPARFLLFICLFPFPGRAQWVSLGVTGGVPVSPHSHVSPQGCLDTLPPACGPNDLYQKPYAIGPTVDVSLPWRFSVESGLLYERFHQDITTGLVVGRGNGYVNFGQRAGLAANAWLFPFLLKYTFGHRRLEPFVEAGATLRHPGAFHGRGLQVDFFLQPQPASFHSESGKDLDAAITAGAGLRWRFMLCDVALQVRYLHWTAIYQQPVQDTAMPMLNIMYPARR